MPPPARHTPAEDYAAARTSVLAALDEEGTNRDMLLLLARTQLRLADGDGAQATLVRLEEAGLRSAEIVADEGRSRDPCAASPMRR